jgi:hypothetical protein
MRREDVLFAKIYSVHDQIEGQRLQVSLEPPNSIHPSRRLQLHVKSLDFAHTATTVDGYGLAASFGRLGSSQQSSNSEWLNLFRFRFNILQSESKTRAEGGLDIIRINGTQQLGGSHGLFEHVVVNNFAGSVRAAPRGVPHLISKFDGNVEFNRTVPNGIANGSAARTGDSSVCIRLSDKCFVHLQGPHKRKPDF